MINERTRHAIVKFQEYAVVLGGFRIINDDSQRDIYNRKVIVKREQYMDQVEGYDKAQDLWIEMEPMIHPRSQLSACTFKRKYTEVVDNFYKETYMEVDLEYIYVFGGIDRNHM